MVEVRVESGPRPGSKYGTELDYYISYDGKRELVPRQLSGRQKREKWVKDYLEQKGYDDVRIQGASLANIEKRFPLGTSGGRVGDRPAGEYIPQDKVKPYTSGAQRAREIVQRALRRREEAKRRESLTKQTREERTQLRMAQGEQQRQEQVIGEKPIKGYERPESNPLQVNEIKRSKEQLALELAAQQEMSKTLGRGSTAFETLKARRLAELKQDLKGGSSTTVTKNLAGYKIELGGSINKFPKNIQGTTTGRKVLSEIEPSIQQGKKSFISKIPEELGFIRSLALIPGEIAGFDYKKASIGKYKKPTLQQQIVSSRNKESIATKQRSGGIPDFFNLLTSTGRQFKRQAPVTTTTTVALTTAGVGASLFPAVASVVLSPPVLIGGSLVAQQKITGQTPGAKQALGTTAEVLTFSGVFKLAKSGSQAYRAARFKQKTSFPKSRYAPYRQTVLFEAENPRSIIRRTIEGPKIINMVKRPQGLIAPQGKYGAVTSTRQLQLFPKDYDVVRGFVKARAEASGSRMRPFLVRPEGLGGQKAIPYFETQRTLSQYGIKAISTRGKLKYYGFGTTRESQQFLKIQPNRQIVDTGISREFFYLKDAGVPSIRRRALSLFRMGKKGRVGLTQQVGLKQYASSFKYSSSDILTTRSTITRIVSAKKIRGRPSSKLYGTVISGFNLGSERSDILQPISRERAYDISIRRTYIGRRKRQRTPILPRSMSVSDTFVGIRSASKPDLRRPTYSIVGPRPGDATTPPGGDGYIRPPTDKPKPPKTVVGMPSIPSTTILRRKKERKRKGLLPRRTFRYIASIVPAQFERYGKRPDVLTGFSPRDLLRGGSF